MKNIQIGSIKHLILQIIIMDIVAILLYPLLDYLYYTFITKSTFTYTISEYIVKPIIDGTVIAVIIWLIEKVMYQKKNK